MVHLYIGDGKGKTSAALGLAIRGAGSKKKVYIGQFLKDKGAFCGEVEFIRQTKVSIEIERFPCQRHPMFCKKGKAFDIRKLKESTRQALEKIERAIDEKKFDVIVLDEILNSIKGKVCSKVVLKRLMKKAESIELILTGRAAAQDLIKSADYVSFIKKIKHPFDKGILARCGIEY